MLRIFALILIVSSCSEEISQKRVSGGTAPKTQKSPLPFPSFENDLNVLQNGNLRSSSTFPISETSQEGVLFWGKQIDTYIRGHARSEVHCLLAKFPSPAEKSHLLMAARPLSNGDTVNTQKYYYQLSPHDNSSNKLFCHTSSMIKNIGVQSSNMAFSLKEVCPNCTGSDLTGTSLMLTNVHGKEVQSVKTQSLKIQIQFESFSTPPASSCTSSSDCRAKGFDCCSANQCIRDGQTRQGIDLKSSEFLQAENDIQQNPGKIYDYPHFYHLCTKKTAIPISPSPPPEPNVDLTSERLIYLQELYQCTTPIEGEKGLCTLTIDNVEGSGTYSAPKDDRDFSFTYTNTRTKLLERNIERITYANQVLYKERKTLVPGSFQFGPSNDSMIDGQKIILSHTPPANGSKKLKIRYQTDASCENRGYNLGRCYKIYVQGQNSGRIDDHYPASNEFLLPFYADTGKSIQIQVDGITKLYGTHWKMEKSPRPKIIFTPPRTPLLVKDNQTVKITFFVDLNQHPVMASKQAALESIKKACQCQDTNCRLKEMKKNGVVTKYTCQYPPPPGPPPPLQQTISLSTKAVPHRYFDNQGNYIKKVVSQTAPQEGKHFAYTNNNLLFPNNVTDTIGFNEIYGTLGTSLHNAFPAQEVSIRKNKRYNIYVDSGQFSSCIKCGQDYYSHQNKLFPHNFLHKGGGYRPDYMVTDRFSRQSPYRSDDLLFGRACWVPATMIPWSHTPMEDLQTQRLRRLSTQHFIFANGYQRDWYGFDYGSVIGSFDGINWFAIGNQRYINAKSNKLFLAVNAYFGDLTRSGNFRVTISESRSVQDADVSIKSNFQSDGAECRKYHLCEKDQDCIAQLGWEYSCENITAMSTQWPVFDHNAQEVPNTTRRQNLADIFGAYGNGNKRCVYRGRGALCQANYQVIDPDTSFNGTTSLGLHACNSNFYCQLFSDDGREKKFNTRISRYGHPPHTLNQNPDVDISGLNTFGLDAKLIGRPERWHGRDEVPPDVFASLNQNNVHALCLPGRNPTDPGRTILDHNQAEPDLSSLGDKVLNIGVTPGGSVGLGHYLSGCSIYDESGNYYQKDPDHLPETLDDADFARQASRQAVPTNSLERLEGLIEEELMTNFESIQVESPILQENRCLRAPGSSCFSDLDCAPSSFITRRTRAIDPDDNSLWMTLNPYEIQFWQEDLICSQKDSPESNDFSLKNNRCCRETGKDVTIGTLIDQSHHGAIDPAIPVFDNANIPGLGIDLDNPLRHTRNATIFDLSGNTTHPPLQSARADACNQPAGCFTRLDFPWDNQYNSFATTAERTCCNGHWIRQFHQDNGGGHKWQPAKAQRTPKESFRCLNWFQCDSTLDTCRADAHFTCHHTDQPDDPNCFAKSTSLTEAEPVFQFISTLELLGIPQIKVKGEQWPEIHCLVNPDDQELPSNRTPIPNLINTSNPAEYADSGRTLRAADDPLNFHEDLELIFSPDKISCCLPAGTQVDENEDPERCCTGFINKASRRCQLPDFSNLSVYFNRYVSSHAKDILPGLFDPETGYIRSPVHVENLACATHVCASGVIARGIALSELYIPGHENSNKKIRRWLDANSDDTQGLDQLYNSGQRWNDHVYCVPEDSTVPTTVNCEER